MPAGTVFYEKSGRPDRKVPEQTTKGENMNFDAFTKDITEHGWNVFGTEVYEDGNLTHSFGDTEGLHELFSATKTIVSVAVGIAYDEGKIDFERSILDYLPKTYVERMQEAQKSAWQTITVRRLLTMSVPGLPFRAEGDDYLEYTLSYLIEEPETATFNYSNICTYLICVALTEIFAEDLGKIIEERIFEPLQITNFEYGRSPEGYFYGASNMKLSVHDLSKIGLLLYHGGVYDGKRIVSEEYCHMASSVQQMNREGGYGFFIWKYRDGFSINGKCKQKCYILPKEGLIVTYLSYIDDDTHDLLLSMEKNILGI
jgi:CubicO group peptidase (beta-lactamase class C family)